jgi:hypothetical protein
MHIFKELLQESQTGLAEKFKAIYDDAKPAWVDRAKDMLTNLETAVAADTIFNVDFNEIKDFMSRSLENVLRKNLDAISSTDSAQSPHRVVYDADVSSYVYLNQAKGQVKKIKDVLAMKSKVFNAADTAHLEKMLAANEAAAEINVILTSLKPKIVKGRKPNTNVDPNAFHSKLGSAEAQKKVKEALEAGVKEPLDDYEEAVRDWIQRYIDRIGKSDTYTQSSDRRQRDGMSDMIFTHCFDFDKDRDASTKDETVYKNVKIRAEKKDFAKKDAEAQRKNIELKYLAKNIKKLSHVVDLKGNLSKIETLEYRKPKIADGGGTLESGFKFIFADGSEFTVINKIVTKYSYAGTKFEQFPTTFHDVKFPDGTKMKMPSEEKMVKEFGSWKAT